MPEPFDPWPQRGGAVVRLVQTRADGMTLRLAALAAGIHPATACRWLHRSPVVARAMSLAAEAARERRRLTRPLRPWVRWHPDCPLCGSTVEVRTSAGSSALVWLCGKRPACAWKSWRPRHPRDCPHCHGPRYWAHSRKSVSCPACGTRTPADPADVRPIPELRWPLPPLRPVPTAAELLAQALAELTQPPPPPPGCIPDGRGGFIRIFGRGARVTPTSP